MMVTGLSLGPQLSTLGIGPSLLGLRNRSRDKHHSHVESFCETWGYNIVGASFSAYVAFSIAET